MMYRYQLIQLRSQMIAFVAYLTTVEIERTLGEEVRCILSYSHTCRFLVKVLRKTTSAACLAYYSPLKTERVCSF
jgi:hypothetical protein